MELKPSLASKLAERQAEDQAFVEANQPRASEMLRDNTQMTCEYTLGAQDRKTLALLAKAANKSVSEYTQELVLEGLQRACRVTEEPAIPNIKELLTEAEKRLSEGMLKLGSADTMIAMILKTLPESNL